MSVMLVTIEYGYTPSDKVTHKIWFSSGDSSDRTGGSGALNLNGTSDPGDSSPITSGRVYISNYLECLREMCQPGIQILMARADQYTGTELADLTLVHTAIQDIVSFTVRTGNTGNRGPRGKAFIGGRQTIPATNKAGWLRWYYVAGNLMTEPTLMTPTEISARFASFYTNLRTLGGSIDYYATWSSALSPSPDFVLKDLPGSVLHFGIRNG